MEVSVFFVVEGRKALLRRQLKLLAGDAIGTTPRRRRKKPLAEGGNSVGFVLRRISSCISLSFVLTADRVRADSWIIVDLRRPPRVALLIPWSCEILFATYPDVPQLFATIARV